MTSLKYQTIVNVLWGMAEQFLNRGLSVATTLILAGFLIPEDYALIAMLAVFIALASVLVDGGLGQALIRKKALEEIELATVFWTNVILAFVFYTAIFFIAPYIAVFYNEPKLIELLRVVSLSVFFQSLIVVQKVVLTRELKFKLQLKIVFPSAILSSIIAIIVASLGGGVWALILQILSNNFFIAFFYWIIKLWRPRLLFSFHALKELWRFSKFILMDSSVSIPFKNMYLIILPKYFASGPVGMYFFSNMIKEAFIDIVVGSVQRVTYPALLKIQEEPIRLKQGYRTVIATTSFMVFPLILALSVFSPILFDLLLPEKWDGAVIYLQLMCLAALLYPIHSINLNMLKLKGRSDLVLYLGIFKKLLIIFIFIFTLQIGITQVIIGQIIASFIGLIPNTYYSSKLMNYSFKEQLVDFLPGLTLSVAVAVIILTLQSLFEWQPLIEFIVLTFLACVLYISGAHFLKLQAYTQIKELLNEKLIEIKSK